MALKYYRNYDELPIFLNPHDLEILLGIEYRTILTNIRNGTIPSVKFGNKYRIKKEWIRDLIPDRSKL